MGRMAGKGSSGSGWKETWTTGQRFTMLLMVRGS
jgi:hypothetical protein